MRSLLLVLEYHAVHKQFPTTLKEAGADAPDPFLKDTPLHYAAGDRTVKVWSVGKNGKDDCGEPKKNADVVAMYPPRKRS
jgi:hypothetical protein